MQKLFRLWHSLKQRLDASAHRAPYVNVGDIWWIHVGKNIGSEINGKSDLFSRPAIVFKKLAHDFFLVIPTTSKIKKGSWYVQIRHQEKEMCACLHQLRTIDHRRLSSRMGTLDEQNMFIIKQGFMNLFF